MSKMLLHFEGVVLLKEKLLTGLLRIKYKYETSSLELW